MPTTPTVANKTAIEVSNLNFFYGNFKGLKDVNLDLAEHKVTAFIGPSGCGKSTLLRTFNRMYSLYPGQRADGRRRPVDRVADHARCRRRAGDAARRTLRSAPAKPERQRRHDP